MNCTCDIQTILNTFSQYQSWYQQSWCCDDEDYCDIIEELDDRRRVEMSGIMGTTVMTFGTQSQKEWLVEFFSEYTSYEWNENLQKFE